MGDDINMIITQIKSGLGNQMFQYACGKALALRNNDTLKLDMSECTRTDIVLWKYRLGVFNIDENFASSEETERIQFPHGKLSRFYLKLRTKAKLFNIGFVPRVIRKKGNVYLNGFWQTEKYFKDFSDQIRMDFTLKKPMGDDAQSIAKIITESSPTVSIHIRRADYVTDKSASNNYGTFTSQYYLDALSYIHSKIGRPLSVFFFSDDIEWVKNNIVIPYKANYVSSPNIADHEELALMSMCEHNIISNSTFGWWGAWLNKNPDKIVTAPKKWTNKRNFVHRDTVPKEWIRL